MNVNYIAPLVFLLSVFVVAAFLLEGAVAFLCRNRKNAPRRPSRAFSVVAALAVATIAVQCFAVGAERARYLTAEEALRTAVSKNDVEARLGTTRGFRLADSSGEPRPEAWVYDFDSPLSPFPFGLPLVVRFDKQDRIVHALWERSGLPPRVIQTGPPPAALEPHAENAETVGFGSPAGGAGEQSEPEGVSHAEDAESISPCVILIETTLPERTIAQVLSTVELKRPRLPRPDQFRPRGTAGRVARGGVAPSRRFW